jgi:predicted Zn-dependent protease
LLSHLKALHPLPGTRAPSRILFRSSPQIGPNAFALPGGTVIVLDQIVQLADSDEQILGVLAHEMGHINERHALRQMLQASVVGLTMAWYVGDISSLLAAAPTALLETRYSRDYESRADQFAIDMLRSNHISPRYLADMLEKLEHAHGGKADKKDSLMNYLSTHPNTAERIRMLRETP